jgi:hypothetical protein
VVIASSLVEMVMRKLRNESSTDKRRDVQKSGPLSDRIHEEHNQRKKRAVFLVYYDWIADLSRKASIVTEYKANYTR